MNYPEKEEQVRLASAMTDIRAVLDKYVHVGGKKDPDFLLQKVIGQMLIDTSYSPNDLESNNVGWSLDYYVANKVGPLWLRLLALHQHLVAAGATPGKPHDFEHCDRYGVAFADEPEWKSMALQTQNYTYMVVLTQETRLEWGADDKFVETQDYATHIRICTKGQRNLDEDRCSFARVEFLADPKQVHPANGYSRDANEYFAYKDGRDRGYLCSIEPETLGPGYRTKDTLWGGYALLKGVVYDLASHCGVLESEQRQRAKKSPAP